MLRLTLLFTLLPALLWADKIKGICLVAPSQPFEVTPMTAIKASNATWIEIIPYAMTVKGSADLQYDAKHQWWGERSTGILETIRLAKANQLKILLKPHVWITGSWVGALDFSTEEEWIQWEKGYLSYIRHFAKIAQDQNVDLFCIGTELKVSIQKRAPFWKNLIKHVKSIYTGKLVYAANWDEYHLVPFWDDLDYIGVDAYFPLLDANTPDVNELVKQWQPTVKKLHKQSEKYGKPILFCEFGYLSLDGCAHNTWELEKKRTTTSINQVGQANALQALFQTFWEKDWWHGGFLWKWYSDPTQQAQKNPIFHAGDYTPQGKKSALILKHWFGKT